MTQNTIDRTGIVILNYNTAPEVLKCIEEIRDKIKADYVIYLVDNASKEEDRAVLVENYKDAPDVVLILSDTNTGYSGGNNLGIKKALQDGLESVVIMNTDVLVQNDIVSIMKKDLKDSAIVLPYVVLPDGSNGQVLMKNFKYAYSFFSKGIFSTRALSRFIKKIPALQIARRVDDWTEPVRFEGMGIGCCFMARTDAMEEIGFLDDNVFLYFEENILGLRLKKDNLKTSYEPLATVVHNHGIATEKASRSLKYFRFYRSEYYLLHTYCNMNALQDIMIRKMIMSEFKKKAKGEAAYNETKAKLEKEIETIRSSQT